MHLALICAAASPRVVDFPLGCQCQLTLWHATDGAAAAARCTSATRLELAFDASAEVCFSPAAASARPAAVASPCGSMMVFAFCGTQSCNSELRPEGTHTRAEQMRRSLHIGSARWHFTGSGREGGCCSVLYVGCTRQTGATMHSIWAAQHAKPVPNSCSPPRSCQTQVCR